VCACVSSAASDSCSLDLRNQLVQLESNILSDAVLRNTFNFQLLFWFLIFFLLLDVVKLINRNVSHNYSCPSVCSYALHVCIVPSAVDSISPGPSSTLTFGEGGRGKGDQEQ